MAETTAIQWAKSTASPWTICTEDNDECSRCYAKALARRRGWGAWGKGKPRHKFVGFESSMRALDRKAEREGAKPGEWRVFPSLCDIFDEEVDDSWRDEYFRLVEETPRLTHIVLTKRAEKMHRYMVGRYGNAPLPHVWLLVSAGRQRSLSEKLPWLFETPAKVRGVSAEPLLGQVDFESVLSQWCGSQKGCVVSAWPRLKDYLHWVIFGGESDQPGLPPSRECDIQWIDDGLDQLIAAGVRCYVKQIGSNPTYGGHKFDKGDIKDPKGGDMEEWIPSIRCREFPIAA